MKKKNKLFIVYAVDTEGPLYESLEATFDRIKQIFNLDLKPSKRNLLKLQKKEIDHPSKDQIARTLNTNLLNYNSNWNDIDRMLDKIMKKSYREKFIDSKGNGIIYNWHCLDHVGFKSNPRRRDIGYGKVFSHYLKKIKEHNSLDKIHWHFHPISLNKGAHISATSYDNSMYYLHQIISRRLIDNDWFPAANRAGFHTIRQDSSLFLEQWIPFDYSNQAEFEKEELHQEDLNNGRFGDWRRAPKDWKPYNPAFDDYQIKGKMNRYTTKCLNVGTRLRLLTDNEIGKAFQLSNKEGKAILSFTNHDFRDMNIDIQDVYRRIFDISKEYKEVEIIHSDSVGAMRDYLYDMKEVKGDKLKLEYKLVKKESSTFLTVTASKGNVFGAQPYLAFKDNNSIYFHDNFDEGEDRDSWSYTFDEQTLNFEAISNLKVAANDKYGNTEILNVV